MAIRFNLPILAFDDANGNPLAGGFIQFFESGGSVTPKDTFSDVALTTPNTNIDLGASDPNVTGYVLDSAGRHGDIWCNIATTDYRAVVRNSFGTIIKTMDPVFGGIVDDDTLQLNTVYDLVINAIGTLANGEVFFIFNAPRALRLPAGLTASQITISSLPTSTLTTTLKKGGVSAGTVAFSTLGVVTKTVASAITLAAGDQLTGTGPGTADATGGNISMTLVFEVL